jgi:hypothetical protein
MDSFIKNPGGMGPTTCSIIFSNFPFFRIRKIIKNKIIYNKIKIKIRKLFIIYSYLQNLKEIIIPNQRKSKLN